MGGIRDFIGQVRAKGEERARAEEDAVRRRKEEEERLRQEREKRITELRSAENELRGHLVSQVGEVGKNIDLELQELTAQVGFRAGEARQDLGAGASERGLLRSSFALKRAGDVENAFLEQRGTLKAEANRKYRAVTGAAQKTLNDIAVRRDELARRIQESERAALSQLANEFRMTDLRTQFETEISTMQMDAKAKAALMNSFSSIFTNLTALGAAANANAAKAAPDTTFAEPPTNTLPASGQNNTTIPSLGGPSFGG